MAQVVVASQPLARGVPLTQAVLKIVNFPQNSVPTDAFHSIGQLIGDKDQQRLALRSLVANEPILPSNVSGPGGKLNLSGVIGPGMRAVSLRSNDVAGVGGFVLPGDRVDVLLTRPTTGNDQNSTVTQILAEDVRVLGVDQSANDEADKPMVSKAVTVEVTPEEAQSISLGQSVGTVSLMLRHVADNAPLAVKTLSVSDLGPSRPHKVETPAGPAVRVIRGVDMSHVTLSAGHADSGAASP
jgi:pilus assembly protein CpaB